MAKDKDTDTTPPEELQVVAKNDAFTGMLMLSLFALIVGCALLFLDLRRYDYPTKAPRTPAISTNLTPIPDDTGDQQPKQKDGGNKGGAAPKKKN